MKRKAAASRTPRALDAVRTRRQGGTAASGNVHGRGIRTLAGGQIEVGLGDGLTFDAQGRITQREPAAPLALAPGSPRRYALLIDNGLTVNSKGKLAPATSTSVQVADGVLIATPSASQVTEPSDGNVQLSIGRIASEIGALGTRTAALEAAPGPGGYFKAGTTTYTALLVPGAGSAVAMNTKALVADTIYARPFTAPDRLAVLDQIEVYVTTGVAGTNIRLGIWANLSEAGGYPGALLLDCGAGSSAVSSKAIQLAISQALTNGGQFWVSALSDGAPTIRSISANGCTPDMGAANLSGTTWITHLTATLAYGALPATFPTAGAAVATSACPAIGLRFSA